MAMPGFTAEYTLMESRNQTLAGRPTAAGELSIVPQDFWQCFQSCQSSWQGCLNSCAWWEWLIGSCVPKCRALWIGCLTRC